MAIYNELNDVKIDLSEFEETQLSKLEKKKVLKRVKRDISPKRPGRKWRTISACAAVAMLGIILTVDKGTVANMPFIGEKIEKHMNENKQLDYSSYKTEIGSTAENGLGKLTLNEVIVDDQRIILSSTFEPASNVDADYQTAITPTVKVNGQDATEITGGQTIELNNEMFTVFNDIELGKEIATEDVEIEIRYERWNRTAIDQPWAFKVKVNQSQMLKERKVIELNKQLTLSNDETIMLQKVVTTPMSTTVYYDLTRSSREDIRVSIHSQKGAVAEHGSSFQSTDTGDISYTRFNESLKSGEYFLMVHDSEGNELDKVPFFIK
ncbi:DUF4179 domain-containing protein [Bacillus sp. B-jedd]|uniref:DUF4179 domain-containing protein n=1 Tax=Bacillus sp. B-jedd TaxID=1476857 RepID=UPI0005155E3F|nr:DUF4179 domain-containing protein [Bacillus sp. B-jedd]CEG28807.1 ECF-type sigma factor negative effector [Bacillus sp. B-jedd]